MCKGGGGGGSLVWLTDFWARFSTTPTRIVFQKWKPMPHHGDWKASFRWWFSINEVGCRQWEKNSQNQREERELLTSHYKRRRPWRRSPNKGVFNDRRLEVRDQSVIAITLEIPPLQIGGGVWDVRVRDGKDDEGHNGGNENDVKEQKGRFKRAKGNLRGEQGDQWEEFGEMGGDQCPLTWFLNLPTEDHTDLIDFFFFLG